MLCKSWEHMGIVLEFRCCTYCLRLFFGRAYCLRLNESFLGVLEWGEVKAKRTKAKHGRRWRRRSCTTPKTGRVAASSSQRSAPKYFLLHYQSSSLAWALILFFLFWFFILSFIPHCCVYIAVTKKWMPIFIFLEFGFNICNPFHHLYQNWSLYSSGPLPLPLGH